MVRCDSDALAVNEDCGVQRLGPEANIDIAVSVMKGRIEAAQGFHEGSRQNHKIGVESICRSHFTLPYANAANLHWPASALAGKTAIGNLSIRAAHQPDHDRGIRGIVRMAIANDGRESVDVEIEIIVQKEVIVPILTHSPCCLER